MTICQLKAELWTEMFDFNVKTADFRARMFSKPALTLLQIVISSCDLWSGLAQAVLYHHVKWHHPLAISCNAMAEYLRFLPPPGPRVSALCQLVNLP